MSKIGQKPISLPDQITVSERNKEILIKGPKGELKIKLPEGIKMQQEEGKLVFFTSKDESSNRLKSLHGLVRSLVASAVTGVMEGFARELELVGLGYKAEVKGDKLVLSLGFSCPIVKKIPSGLSVSVEKNIIKIEGIDKALVGGFSAEIRASRKPEPYKGKGIRYKGETIRRKVGKAAKAVAV